MPPIPEKIQAVLTAIEAGGATLQACRSQNITVFELYKWVDTDDETRTFWRRLMDSRILLVEDALFANAIKGNPIAQLFFLKCRNPHVFNEDAARQIKQEGAKFKRRLFDLELNEPKATPGTLKALTAPRGKKSHKKRDHQKEIIENLNIKDDVKRIRIIEEEFSEDD